MKSKIKSINLEEFFKLASVNSGVSDIETTKRVYYGIIRTITRELKGKGKILLPDFGEFSLRIRKVQRGFDINTRSMVPRTPIAVVRFTPHKAVKKFFYDLGKESTMIK